jgi:hypothetical protein
MVDLAKKGGRNSTFFIGIKSKPPKEEQKNVTHALS